MDIPQRLQEGLQHHQAGRLEEAHAIYRSILGEDPEHAETLYLVSVLNLQVGRFENAATLIDRAISARGDEPNYHNIAGEARLALGDAESAIAAYERAIALDPDFAGAHNNLGNAYRQLGRLADAVSHYRRAVAIDPGMAMAHNNLGISLKASGRADEALEHLRKAVSIAPDYAEAHSNLGNLLQELGRLDEAIAHHQRAVASDPDFAMAHYNLGTAVDEAGQPREAAAHYRRALALEPDYAEAHHNLANVLDQLGERDDAVEHYSRAVGIRPDYAEAHRNLARVDPRQADALAIERLLAVPSLPERDAVHCCFALGAIYDHAGEYDRAFANYSRGNSLARKSVTYDASAWTNYIDALMATFSADFFRNGAPAGSDSGLPVFIVGMPRSGTTLVEQIVSSHGDVFGAGELDTLGRFEEELADRLGAPGSLTEVPAQLDSDTVADLSRRYLDELRALSPDAKRVTDKMPGNFTQVGLIRTLFPGCRIIHCRRHAMDTCLSNYFNYFAVGNPYSFDLGELGRYYRDYERIMSHWAALFGSDILDVHYEDLVKDQEAETRRMIAYLGLDWDERCLRYYENRRAVHNLSSGQVRRPVYGSSVGRWKNYEEHLQPLLEVLGPS